MEINREALAMALTDQGPEAWYFDRETGETLPDLDGELDPEDDRFVRVYPMRPGEAYDFRVDFARSMPDPRLRARLEDALRGKGAFRRFLNAVRDHADLEARWFAEEAQWLDKHVTEWLIEQGLVPAPVDADVPNESAISTASASPTEEELVQRITEDPAICHGQPSIRGLRYPVATVLRWLGSGMTCDEVLADHPDLERDDLSAALLFAARLCQTRHLGRSPRP